MAAPPVPRSPPTREARFARRLLWLIPSTVVGLFVLSRLVITSDFVSQRIAERVAGAVADRTRASVQLSGMSFGLSFAPCLHDLTIYRNDGPLELRLVARRACVEQWASALGSGFRSVRLRFEETSIEAIGRTDEADRAAAVNVQPSAKTKVGDKKAALREIGVNFDGLRLRWQDLPLPTRFSDGSFGPIDGGITVQKRGAASAAIIAMRDPESGAEVNARANPTAEGWNLSAGIEGDLVPIFGSLLKFSNVDIQRMPARGRAGLNYVSKDKQLTLDLDHEEHDAALESDAVAKEALTGFTARQRLRAELNLEQRTLQVEEGLLEINGIPVILSVRVKPGETSPRFRIKADLRTTPFARLLKSVPGGERLEIARRISPALTFALSAVVGGELSEPDTWQPEVNYQFRSIDPQKTFTGLEFTQGPFEYFPLTPDGREEAARIVGPTSAPWVPYRRIPYILRRAIVVSEDASFPFHQGIDLEEGRAALQDAMLGAERPRGGSTISQQLVKNLFLSRDRTAQRKALELLLTFHMESWLKKNEIFALYANVIEWGPDIYGIGPAAQHYFGRPPWRLNPLEMAYLATLIPSPIPLHVHYERGSVPRRHLRKVHALLERLNRLGQLSDEQLAGAKGARLRFARRPEAPEPKDEEVQN